MSRTALELIGQSGLGYSFDPLTQDSIPHPYGTAAKSLSYVDFPEVTIIEFSVDNYTRPTLFKMSFLRAYFLPTCLKIGTPKFRRFVMDILPWKTLHEIRDIVDVLHNTSVDIFETKKKALEAGDEAVTEQVGRCKDIMSILSAYHLFLGHKRS